MQSCSLASCAALQLDPQGPGAGRQSHSARPAAGAPLFIQPFLSALLYHQCCCRLLFHGLSSPPLTSSE